MKLINIYQIQINKRQITNNNDNIQHEHRVFNQKKVITQPKCYFIGPPFSFTTVFIRG